jgi:glycosyltransferase involved in cell wall biosynthesis
MRVLVLTETFPTVEHPGRGIFIRAQVTALADCHEITVLFPRPWLPGVPSRWLESRARKLETRTPFSDVLPVTLKRPPYLYVPRNREIRSRQLAALARRELFDSGEHYDLIHAHWLSPPGLAAIRAVADAPIPVVVTAHAGDVYRDLARSAYRLTARTVVGGATRIIAVADYFRDPLESLGADPDRMRIIPNGVDTRLFRPQDRGATRQALDLPQECPLFLYVGNLEPAKGVLDTVHAFFSSAPEKARLLLAGTGSLWTDLERQARHSEGRLILRGWQSHESVSQYLAAADCFVLPSYGEGNPVTVLESLCCGTTVIGSAISALTALIKPGQNGLLVPAGAVSELGFAMQETTRRRWDREAISREAQSRFGWITVAAQISSVYAEAVAECRSRSGMERVRRS